MIEVSFIVAIYNVGHFLPQCIESIINQNMKNVEIILVNDGSTDNSLAICKDYARQDARIRVIDQENGGANAARNRGLREAKGEWVYFVDGDDFVDATVCTGIQEYLKLDYDIVLFSHARFANGKVIPVPYAKSKIEFSKIDFKELQFAALNRLGDYRYNYRVLDAATLCNKMYRRSFLMANNISFIPGFPKLQDMSFNLKAYDYANKAIYVPNIGYYYRYNDQSVSHRYQSNLLEKFDVINAWFKQFAESKREDAGYMRAYRERIATHMRTCIVLYFCNGENKAPYRERRAEFLHLRAIEPYCSALDQTGILAFCGYKERVLAFAVKYRWFALCEILCFMYEKLNSVK